MRLLNRVRVNTATTGTGTVTLGAAFSNAFCTFAEAGAANGDVVTYVLEEGNDFEIGRGTYTSSGTTLSRTTVLLSKIAGTAGTTKMTLAGGATVRIDAVAEDLILASQTQSANTVLAGPASGGAVVPAFRGLTMADLPSLSQITASLGSNVALSNTAAFFDGPGVAQGSTGTWFASGTVTLLDSTAAVRFKVKLWDGTTVIASTRVLAASGFQTPVSLSGFIASPAGNIRISVLDESTTSGFIMANDSGQGKDSTITAFRIA